MRVLIVDDNCEFAELLAQNLEKSGLESEACCDSAEAIALMGSGEFDAVVTDLHMPEVDGIQLIVEARKKFPDLPMVAMSGVHADVALQGAKRLGARACLEKPFEREALIECLNELVSEDS